MWPFSKKPKPATLGEHPRYGKQPINLLIEALVLDVIGHLLAAKRQALEAMNLQKVFNTRASEWRAVLRETLHRSDTIEVAILDLWYRNRENAYEKKYRRLESPLLARRRMTSACSRPGGRRGPCRSRVRAAPPGR
jgi:hypothetical protein